MNMMSLHDAVVVGLVDSFCVHVLSVVIGHFSMIDDLPVVVVVVAADNIHFGLDYILVAAVSELYHSLLVVLSFCLLNAVY